MNEHEAAGAGARQGAIRPPRDECRRDGRIHRVAAFAQDACARLRGQRMPRGDRTSHAATVPGKQAGTFNVRKEMRRDLDLNSLISRRALATGALFLAAVGVLVTRPGLLGHQVRDAALGIEDARPAWLWL